MREGPCFKFKDHDIIQDINTKQYYIYKNNQEVWQTPDFREAKNYIVQLITKYNLDILTHPGVLLFSYEFHDKLYIISVMEEMLQKYPYFDKLKYSDLGPYGRASGWEKYLHNEKGPANICVDTKTSLFFWKGEKLTEEQWNQKVRQNVFNKKFDEFLE